ncbi:MAG: hypothetical protein ACYDBQ_07235 [Thermoplasmatota archaeon]
MPYTPSDTPLVEARIGADLDDIVSTVRAADPALRAVVLTGGFARGEGGILDGRPVNDYDIVAVRAVGTPAPYRAVRAKLEARLGLHVDLAPVAAWRLRWVPRSIFWYETALRGRVLWGAPVLEPMRARMAQGVHRGEALRLLANRAAGLLLVSEEASPFLRSIQAAKALLASGDALLLAQGKFAPSQLERRPLLETLPGAPLEADRWLAWAYEFKRDSRAWNRVDPGAAWRAARKSLLDAVPAALQLAGFASLEAYARSDTVAGRLAYQLRVRRVAGARRWVTHPTGRLRVATLCLLGASVGGRVPRAAAQNLLGAMARKVADPLELLAGLRGATLQ